MNVSKHSSFYYHADANALGGVIRQPIEHVVSTRASVSLAHAGGFSSKGLREFRVDGILSFKSAKTHVSGSEHEDRGWRSTSTATIDGLNVLDILTADHIAAQVSVMRRRDHGPAEISLLGTQFVNLRVNGELVDPDLDRRVFGVDPARQQAGTPAGSPSFEDLIGVAGEQYTGNADTRKLMVERLGDRFAWEHPDHSLQHRGSAICSLVAKTKVSAPGQSYAHVIHVPELGNIFLGEMLVSRFSVELTMMRVEMGCVAHGSVSACTARSNGQPCP